MRKTSTLLSGHFLSLCAGENVIPLPLCPRDIDCPPEQPTGHPLIRLQLPYQLAKHAQLRSQHQPMSSSYPPSDVSLMFFLTCPPAALWVHPMHPPSPWRFHYLRWPARFPCCCWLHVAAAQDSTINMWQQLFPHPQRNQGL